MIVKGKTGTYNVNVTNCTCGEYVYRKKHRNGLCKHILLVRDMLKWC